MTAPANPKDIVDTSVRRWAGLWRGGAVRWQAPYHDLINDITEAIAAARTEAAADLYAALEGIVNDDGPSVSLADQRSRHDARMEAAKAALSKARGETP